MFFVSYFFCFFRDLRVAVPTCLYLSRVRSRHIRRQCSPTPNLLNSSGSFARPNYSACKDVRARILHACHTIRAVHLGMDVYSRRRILTISLFIQHTRAYCVTATMETDSYSHPVGNNTRYDTYSCIRTLHFWYVSGGGMNCVICDIHQRAADLCLTYFTYVLLSVRLSGCPAVWCQVIFIYLFVCLFIYLFIYFFIFLFIYLFIFLFIYLFIDLFICLFIYFFICCHPIL